MLRKFVLATLVMISLIAPLRAEDATNKVVNPVAILIEFDPWLMVIGSDSPSFVMYEGGKIIYRSEDGYKTVIASPAQQNEILSAMQFEQTNGTLMAANLTDQPTNVLILRKEDKLVRASVYGNLERADARSRVPAPILTAYDKLNGFSDPSAIGWLPEKIEVMIWPYEHASEASILWPKEWPGIDADDTVQRGDSYSIYLPATEFEEFKAFLITKNQKGAVEIGGKKWAVSWRLPFPRIKVRMSHSSPPTD